MIAPARIDPTAVARNLTGRDYISYSAISSYQRCPLAYRFKYVNGLVEKTISSNLVFGSGIHSAAEFHFNELMAGGAPPKLDALLSAFWDSWKERGEEAVIQFGKKEDLNTVTDTAKRVLQAFIQSEFARPRGRIIGVEEQLRGCLSAKLPEDAGLCRPDARNGRYVDRDRSEDGSEPLDRIAGGKLWRSTRALRRTGPTASPRQGDQPGVRGCNEDEGAKRRDIARCK